MSTKKLADSTLYHLHPTGFWKKFRDATVVNPEISSGIPLATEHRRPTPASRPEHYSTPATRASDPAQNPYWKRDVRRTYPQLSVVTQKELSMLLIQHNTPPAIPPPVKEGEKAVPAPLPEPVDLITAIAKLNQDGAVKVYTEDKLPPKVPSSFKRWSPTITENAPHDENAYWPMVLFK